MADPARWYQAGFYPAPPGRQGSLPVRPPGMDPGSAPPIGPRTAGAALSALPVFGGVMPQAPQRDGQMFEPIQSDLAELSILEDPAESTPGDLGMDINQLQSAPPVPKKRRKRAVP